MVEQFTIPLHRLNGTVFRIGANICITTTNNRPRRNRGMKKNNTMSKITELRKAVEAMPELFTTEQLVQYLGTSYDHKTLGYLHNYAERTNKNSHLWRKIKPTTFERKCDDKAMIEHLKSKGYKVFKMIEC